MMCGENAGKEEFSFALLQVIEKKEPNQLRPLHYSSGSVKKNGQLLL